MYGGSRGYNPGDYGARPDYSTGHEVVESFGWQDRLRAALDRNGNLESETHSFQQIFKEAAARHGGAALVTGNLREAVVAAAAVRDLAKGKPRRKVTLVTPTVDGAMGASYLLSSLVDTSAKIGEKVGYLTGQGKLIGDNAEIAVTTVGALSRNILEGKVDYNSVGTIVVEGADEDRPENKLMLLALKDLRQRGGAPNLIFFSRRADSVEALSELLEVVDLDAWQPLKEIISPLPEKIFYEDAERPHHVKIEDRAGEILNGILTGKKETEGDVMVFVRDDEMLRGILRKIGGNFSQSWVAGGTLENKDWRVEVVSHDRPLEECLRSELSSPPKPRSRKDLGTTGKKRIVFSTLPADVLRVTGQFSVVVDTYRSERKGGYFSISSEEADRRAAFAGTQGECYRLVNEGEYQDSQYPEDRIGFELSNVDVSSIRKELVKAGKDPASFPDIGPDFQEPEALKEETGKSEEERPRDKISELSERLKVEAPVARVVQEFIDQGKGEVGLAFAACVRESRFFDEDSGWQAARQLGTGSDIVLRLKILSDFLQNHMVYYEGVRTESLGHVEAMLTRWDRNFNRRKFCEDLRRLFRGDGQANQDEYHPKLCEDKITEVLLRVMPERLAYISGVSFRPVEFINEQLAGSLNGSVARGLVLEQACGNFFVAAGLGGRDGGLVTAGHPVPLEIVLATVPEKVRLSGAELVLEYGKVVRKSRLEVAIQSVFSGKKEWRRVEDIFQDVPAGEAEQFLSDQREEEQRREKFKESIKNRTEELLAALGAIRDKASGPSKTAAEERISAIEREVKRLDSPDVDLNEVEKFFATQEQKILTLSRKVAREVGWKNPEWWSQLQEKLLVVPAAIRAHEFAREVMTEDENITFSSLVDVLRKKLLSEGIEMSQKGQEVSLPNFVDAILEEIVA